MILKVEAFRGRAETARRISYGWCRVETHPNALTAFSTSIPLPEYTTSTRIRYEEGTHPGALLVTIHLLHTASL